MKNFSALAVILVGFIFVMSSSYDVYSQSGGSAGSYLRTGTGVRPLSLGGAFVAVANDVTAGYWNAAGLGQLQETQFVGMYSLLSMNRMYNYSAIAHPIKSFGTLGFSWVNFQVGNIEARNSSGQVTGTFGNTENAFIFSYGTSFSGFFFVGGSVKYLLHSLAGSSAQGLGFDAGVLLKPISLFSLGASVQDIDTKIEWDTPSQPVFKFPRTVRTGIAVHPSNLPFTLSFDYEKNNLQKARFHGGVELFLINQFGFRVGNDNGKFTFGGCIAVPFARNELLMDYGFFATDGIDQNPVHRISIMLKLLKPSKVTTTKEPIKIPPIANKVTPKLPERIDEKPISQESKSSFLLAKVYKIQGDYLFLKIGLLNGLTQDVVYQIFLINNNNGLLQSNYQGNVKVFRALQQTSVVKIFIKSNSFDLKVGNVIELKSVE